MNFTADNFHQFCDTVAERDEALQQVIARYGYPPLWMREPGFETLIHIILEQQVSLASAKAALDKLKEKTGVITPMAVLALTDEELRSCYFSRQKMGYARNLAEAIHTKKIDLEKLAAENDDSAREILKALKGIGDWTVDVYLLMALQRPDIFPTGDLAMVNSLRKIKGLPANTPKEVLINIAEAWRPYRSLGVMICWHAYLSERKKTG